MQERFARGFEQYVRKGKAPNHPVQTVFQKLQKKLTQIYSAFRGNGGRATPEVEEAMGRMLVTKSRFLAKETAERRLRSILTPVQKQLKALVSKRLSSR